MCRINASDSAQTNPTVAEFENNTFKGELFMKGRIRIATLLNIGWKIIFDKEIRNLYELCSDSKRTSS